MKTLVIALALSTLIAAPAFAQSAIEAPRIKICDNSQSGHEVDGRYPGYPSTSCYRW